MINTKLIWITPDAEQHIAYCARVSNPANQDNPDTKGILKYMVKHNHWSPFEMASACIEITTTRDIARQILRHRSFSYQEFCIAGSSEITLELPSGVSSGKRRAYKRTVEHLYNLQSTNPKGMPSHIRVYDEDSKTFITTGIREVFKTGIKPLYRLTLENGKSIDCTKEHKLYTENGFETLENAVGLHLTNTGKATISKNAAFACNGVPAYQNFDTLQHVKNLSIADKTGLFGIAEKLSANVNTIRKWLRKHSIQFTKLEIKSYTDSWNKGKSGYKTKGHTVETINKMRLSAKRGSESNLWKGGASRAERLRISDWCNSIRAEKLKNSNYSCSKCGSNHKLELHHIKTVSEYPELAYDMDNIDVLCTVCHREHHKLCGDAKTWRTKSVGNSLSIHYSKVKSVEYLGEQMTYDIEVDHASHNYVANGIVTHNSQRYADISTLPEPELRECRLQDHKNRQSSLETTDFELSSRWSEMQSVVNHLSNKLYKEAIESGVAKEVARALLPEGLTTSRMYMSGTIRSWLHYCQVRMDMSTQKEHRDIANQIYAILKSQLPNVFSEELKC